MSRINLTILVNTSWRDRFPQVVESCRQAGMTIERELIAVGVIAGSIDEASVGVLEQIEGVHTIEPERTNRGLE